MARTGNRKAILLDDVEHLGHRGDIVAVSRGYLRNYLVPRKLAEEGTAFDIILNEARITLSQELLRNNRLTIDAIAVRLGYAHPSAFIRFFRQQFWGTPGCMARQQQSGV